MYFMGMPDLHKAEKRSFLPIFLLRLFAAFYLSFWARNTRNCTNENNLQAQLANLTLHLLHLLHLHDWINPGIGPRTP